MDVRAVIQRIINNTRLPFHYFHIGTIHLRRRHSLGGDFYCWHSFGEKSYIIRVVFDLLYNKICLCNTAMYIHNWFSFIFLQPTFHLIINESTRWSNFSNTFNQKMVFCYKNCSDLLWEKIVLVIEKNFWNSRLKAEKLQNVWDHLNNFW